MANNLVDMKLSRADEEKAWVLHFQYENRSGDSRYMALILYEGMDIVSTGTDKWTGFPTDSLDQYLERCAITMREDAQK